MASDGNIENSAIDDLVLDNTLHPFEQGVCNSSEAIMRAAWNAGNSLLVILEANVDQPLVRGLSSPDQDDQHAILLQEYSEGGGREALRQAGLCEINGLQQCPSRRHRQGHIGCVVIRTWRPILEIFNAAMIPVVVGPLPGRKQM